MQATKSEQLELEASTALSNLQNFKTAPDSILSYIARLRKLSEPILNAASLILPSPAKEIADQVLWFFQMSANLQSLFVVNRAAVEKSAELQKQLGRLYDEILKMVKMAERYSTEKGIRGFIMRLIRMKKDSSELFVIQRNLEQILMVVDTTMGLETKADIQRLLKFQENLGDNMKTLGSTVAELGGIDNIQQWTDEQFQTVLKLMEPQEALQFSLLQEITQTMQEGPHSLIENELIREFWQKVSGGKFQMEYDEFWSALQQYYSEDPEVISLISEEAYRSQFQQALDDGLDFRYITVTELNDAFKPSAHIGVKEVLYWLLGKSVVMSDRSDIAAFTNCIEFLGENKYRLRGMCTGDSFQKLLDFVAPGTEIDLQSYRVNCCGHLKIQKGVVIKGNKAVILCDDEGILAYRTKIPIKFVGVKFVVGQAVSQMGTMLTVLEGAEVEIENCIFQGSEQDIILGTSSTGTSDKNGDESQLFTAFGQFSVSKNSSSTPFLGIKSEQWSKLSISKSAIRQCVIGMNIEGSCTMKSSQIEYCKIGLNLKQQDSNLFLSSVFIGKQVQYGLIINEGNAELNEISVKPGFYNNQSIGVLVLYGGSVKFVGLGESRVAGGQYGIVVQEYSEVSVLQDLYVKDCQKSAVYVSNYSVLKELKGSIQYQDIQRRIENTQHGSHVLIE